MKWLIAEDALKNRQGHWSEYIDTFRSGLRELGHEVTVLADRSAEPFIADQPDVHPVMPHSIWDRMGDQASRLTRYARVPMHAWDTIRAIKRWLSSNERPDLIFVPTVLVHHLLGWWRLYETQLKGTSTRLLLFFPNTPLTYDEQTGGAVLGRDPTARLFGWLIGRLAEGVASGQVVLGVETHSMRDALSEVTGVPFTYLPHPVDFQTDSSSEAASSQPPPPQSSPLRFGCYGAARFEKGSDLLQAAIAKHLDEHPESDSRFAIQWLSPFDDAQGNPVSPDPQLAADDRVHFIDAYFEEGGYDRQLAQTDVMLLPYREPYRYRVSRVVIEAMVHAMPVVATRGTTLWEQAERLGSALPCELGDVDSLASAIRAMEANRHELVSRAVDNAPRAASHFSVRHFCSLLADGDAKEAS